MATNENGEVPKLPPDARLDSLEERLDRVQRIEAERTRVTPVDPSYRVGNQVLGHLVGGPLGGGLIGWGLDYWLGTTPWLFLAMLFLGFGVGIRNVLRISGTSPGTTPETKSKR